MKIAPDDELQAMLEKLPNVHQDASARVSTLMKTLQALVADARGGALGTDPRSSRRAPGLLMRWLGWEPILPAVLALAGALYVHGAVQQLRVIFGRPPAAEVL